MPKTPKNHGKEWSAQDEKKLKDLAKGNTPTGLIAMKMDRTPAAVRNKAHENGVSLKPTNQSPYGTKSPKKPR